MKKLLAIMLCLAMVVSCFSFSVFAEDEISIIINGQKLTMDQPPIIVEGRTLVPLRAIFEGLGAQVSWDDTTKTATGIKDGKEIKITINNTVAKVDGKDVTLDVPAQIVNSRTLVPVRFISESLGCKVDWNGETRTVIIASEGKVKQWIFDDLDKFESKVDFIEGGGYEAGKASLSSDVDHTTGTGKSFKIDGKTGTNNRVKLIDVFSPSDVGKTFEISAWFYFPEKSSKVKLSTYGASGTEYATHAYKFAEGNVKAGEWTCVTLVYTHDNESVTQLGFEQYMTANLPLFYIDDIKVTETGYSSVSDDKTEGKKWIFDNLDKFENKVDFVEGGGYKAANASLSSDVDHTTGTGKSFKIDGKTGTNNRVKLIDVFSPSDVGKTFTISAWFYFPEKPSKVKLSTYGASGTEYATKAYKFAEGSIKSGEWTCVTLVYTHDNESVTQLGFEQYMTANLPLFYIDDIEVYESSESKEEKIEVAFVTDGHRPVPTEFSVGTSFDELIYFGTDKKTPEQLLAALPDGKVIVDNDMFIKSITGESNKQYYENTTAGKMEIIDVLGQPFDKAVRATVYNPIEPPYAYQISMGPLLAGKAEVNDVCLLKLYMRTESGGSGEAQMGQVQVVVEENGGAHDKTLATNVVNAKEWKVFYFPFKFKDNHTRTNIRLGYYTQIVDLGGYEIINYGQNVNIEDLPTDSNSAPFLMPGAAWRKEAWDRIEKIRKGDFKVIVKDALGNVVPNADITFNMYEHEFQWGVAVSDAVLTDALTQKVVSENFNGAVLYERCKWARYEENPQIAQDTLKKLKELGIKYIRGHALLRDKKWSEGNTDIPDDLPSLYNDKEALQKRVKEHIMGITSDLKEYIPYEWDVLNEAVRNTVMQDIHGIELVKEWFDMAREAMGEEGVLYYNDFRREQEFFDMIDKYVEMGVDFDGIGIQSHYGSPENPEAIYELFNKMSEHGNRIKVTEYDFMTGDNELQANFLRDFMIISFSHEKMDGFFMWGWKGGGKDNKYPLYDGDGQPKEGLAIWQDLLYNKWWTKENGKTNANGEFNVRGYYGDYDVTVNVNGTSKKVSAPFYKDKNNTLIITLD